MKKNRKRGKTFKTNNVAMKCSRCKKRGHNKRTCGRLSANQPPPPTNPSNTTQHSSALLSKSEMGERRKGWERVSGIGVLRTTSIPDTEVVHLKNVILKVGKVSMVHKDDNENLTGEEIRTWWELVKKENSKTQLYPWQGTPNRADEISTFINELYPKNPTEEETWQWQTFTETLSENDQIAVASSNRMPEQILNVLAKSTSPRVKQELARNRLITNVIVDELITDTSENVRYHLASNPKISPNYHTTLARDKSKLVKKGLALNRNVKKEALDIMLITETDLDMVNIIKSGLKHYEKYEEKGES